MDPYRIDAEKLYLAICTEPFGTRIFVSEDGDIHTIEGSMSLRGFDGWLYFGRAEGNFNRDDWGVGSEGEAFAVEGVDGRFESPEDALRAAVEAFGLPAEIRDDLIERAERRLAETAAEQAAR